MALAKDATSEDQAFVLETKRRFSESRWLIERAWWGNLLYLMGVQWIVYDTNARRWRMRKLAPSVPTPITNLFRATLDTVKSVLAQHDPRFLATPERDDPHAVAAASNADTMLQVILAQGKFRKTRRRMLDWLIVTGTAGIEPVFDDSEDTGTVEVPFDHCDDCGTESEPDAIDESNPRCPVCTSSLLSDSTSQFKTTPRGEMRFDVKSPFEIYLDRAIEEIEDQPILMLVESYTTEQVYLRWGVEVDQDSDLTSGTSHMKEAAASVGSSSVVPISAQGGAVRQNRVTVYRVFVKYHKDYKHGAYICMTAGGKLLDKKTPYPWKRRKNGRAFFPLVMFRFGTAAGRAWGYTPADDLLPKQYQLNKAESLMTMILSRMANPVWLIPVNSNPTRITGEIGIQIEYTPVGTTAPARVPGAEAPQSLVKYIVDLRQSFDELSGAFAAIRGRATGTRTPVGTTQSMVDRGFGRWATVFDGLEEGYEDVAKNALEIWRQSSMAPRVQAVKNALGGWTFNAFEQADWDDGVDIQVEAGSTRPKTQSEKLQTYQQLIQATLLDVTDPAQRIKILEDTGMANMLVGVEEDTKQAYKENAAFMAWAAKVSDTALAMPHAGDPEGADQVNALLSVGPGHDFMVHPLVDNHAMHFLAHRRQALTDEFKALPDACQQVFFLHMIEHKMDEAAGASTAKPPLTALPDQNQAPAKPSSGSGGAPVTKGA